MATNRTPRRFTGFHRYRQRRRDRETDPRALSAIASSRGGQRRNQGLPMALSPAQRARSRKASKRSEAGSIAAPANGAPLTARIHGSRFTGRLQRHEAGMSEGVAKLPIDQLVYANLYDPIDGSNAADWWDSWNSLTHDSSHSFCSTSGNSQSSVHPLIAYSGVLVRCCSAAASRSGERGIVQILAPSAGTRGGIIEIEVRHRVGRRLVEQPPGCGGFRRWRF